MDEDRDVIQDEVMAKGEVMKEENFIVITIIILIIHRTSVGIKLETLVGKSSVSERGEFIFDFLPFYTL